MTFFFQPRSQNYVHYMLPAEPCHNSTLTPVQNAIFPLQPLQHQQNSSSPRRRRTWSPNACKNPNPEPRPSVTEEPLQVLPSAKRRSPWPLCKPCSKSLGRRPKFCGSCAFGAKVQGHRNPDRGFRILGSRLWGGTAAISDQCTADAKPKQN